MSETTDSITGFLILLRDNPTLMPPVLGTVAYALQIEHRCRDEVHSCLRCGERAECAYVADTKQGMRWLDLCPPHAYEVAAA